MWPIPMDPGDLFALQFLLEERHVTRAAARLGVTQSTMSHRLAKLREALGDELLVSDGNELLLSSRAEEMLAPLQGAIAQLHSAVSPPGPFVPSEAVLQVTMALPDLMAPLLPRLVNHMSQLAPGVTFRIVSLGPGLNERLADGSCDLCILPEMFASSDSMVRTLGDLNMGVFLRRSHPLSNKKLTLKRWLEYPHVAVSIDHPSKNPLSVELKKRGLERKIGLCVPSFLAGLTVVAESDMLMNAPVELAAEIAERSDLRTSKLPIRMAPIRFGMQWHARRNSDPVHVWLRERIVEFVAPLLGGAKRGQPRKC